MIETNSIINLVETSKVHSKEDIFSKHKEFVNRGFEGSIIRNLDGLYKFNRSYDLLKLKDFQDEEFLITDIREDKNLEAVFTCITKDKVEFEVKPEGTHEERVKYLDRKNVGKLLNVRFFEWTTGDNPVPRFPVGIYIREEL